jgi:hypothetical protein
MRIYNAKGLLLYSVSCLLMQAATQTSRNLACNQSGQPWQIAHYSQQHRMHTVSSVEHQLGALPGFACGCVLYSQRQHTPGGSVSYCGVLIHHHRLAGSGSTRS